MISSADPHEILILIEWWKISPLARLQVRARKICIVRIVDFGQFWPIFAQKCSGFPAGKFFPVMGNSSLWWETLETFRDQSALLGEYLSQKLTLAQPYNPIFWPKTSFLGYKNTLKNYFLGVFVKKPIKPLGKIFQTQKQIVKIFFPLGATSKKNTP